MIRHLLMCIVTLCVAMGCSKDQTAKPPRDRSPMHLTLICNIALQRLSTKLTLTHPKKDAYGTWGINCTEDEKRAFLQKARELNIADRGDSTLTVLGHWTGHTNYRTHMVMCVPKRWGSFPQQAKAQFYDAVRTNLYAPFVRDRPHTLPKGCKLPENSTPGTHQVWVSKELAPFSQDQWRGLLTANADKPQHVSIVCGRGKYLDACNSSTLQQAFDSSIPPGLPAGSTWDLTVVGLDVFPIGSVLNMTIPDRPLAERVAAVIGARQEIIAKLSDYPREGIKQADGTYREYSRAILNTMYAAVGTIRDYRGPGVRKLIVLHDMQHQGVDLQGRSTGANFSVALPSVTQFVDVLNQEKTFGDISPFHITLCGFHDVLLSKERRVESHGTKEVVEEQKTEQKSKRNKNKNVVAAAARPQVVPQRVDRYITRHVDGVRLINFWKETFLKLGVASDNLYLSTHCSSAFH